jgi:hypothetical protein
VSRVICEAMRAPKQNTDIAELCDELRSLAASIAKLISASESENEQGSWTLKQFRERHRLSESQLFKLFHEARGPRVMSVGNVGKRVSREAEAAWVREREDEAREKAEAADRAEAVAAETPATSVGLPSKKAAGDGGKVPGPPAQPKLGEPAQVAPGFGKAPHLGRRPAAQAAPEPHPAPSSRKRKRDSAAAAE